MLQRVDFMGKHSHLIGSCLLSISGGRLIGSLTGEG